MARGGVWLVGGQGSLASTVVLGARAIACRLAAGGGLVTELPELARLPLAGLGDLAFGGWDIAPGGLVGHARALASDDAAVAESLVVRLEDDLEAVEARMRPGFADGGGPANRPRRLRAFVPRSESLAAAVERLGDDLDRFRSEQKLDTVIVVNVASTEPPIELTREHRRLDRLKRLIQRDRGALVTPSMVYAYAALERGFPYVNFTPSSALAARALQELGLKHHVPSYGSDGKTGETLVKAVLAPLFRYRNLEVLSWKGFSILGGRRPGARRSAPQAVEGAEQGRRPRRAARLRAPFPGGDRVRVVPRQLEDRVGLHPFPRLSRHEDERALHLAGLRLDPGRAAGAGSGEARRVRPAERRGRAHGPPGVLLQRPARGDRAVVRRAVPVADRLRRALYEERPPHQEREEAATGAVRPQRWPILEAGDRAAVGRVLGRGVLSGAGAPEMRALEAEFAAAGGARFCLATNSGTAALHLALAAMGLGPGDEVIVPALSFIATAQAVLHQGAVPVFADADPVTYNLDPADAARRVTPPTRAIVPVHLHGLPADMDAVNALAGRHGLTVIEDAAQAHGAVYKGALQEIGWVRDPLGLCSDRAKGGSEGCAKWRSTG